MRLNCGEPGSSFVFCTYSGYKQHLPRAHGGWVDSDLVSNVEFEPAANVAVSQPVNVDPPVTVMTHIPIEKSKIVDVQLCYCSSASLRSS